MSLFSHFRSARSSDTSSGDSKSKATSSSPSSVVELQPLMKSGVPRSAAISAISSLPETRRLVVETALDELFAKKSFSICALDSILAIIEAPQRGDAYQLLRALHCVDYVAMKPEVRARIPALIAEAMKGGNSSRLATNAVMAALFAGGGDGSPDWGG